MNPGTKLFSLIVSIGLWLGCMALGLETETDLMSLAPLLALLFLTEFLALPMPGRGHLSHAFVWVFLVAELSTSGLASIFFVGALFVRVWLLGKEKMEVRHLHFASEGIPVLASLLLLELTASDESLGFPKGYLSAVLSLTIYYLLGRVCLHQFYRDSGPNKGYFIAASQSRELQIRLCAAMAPAAVLLASGGIWRSLWILPMMLAVHQFFWEKLEKIKTLGLDRREQHQKLIEKDSELRERSSELTRTESDRDLIQRCLESFASAATTEQTAESILSLATSITSGSIFALFWKSEAGFGPLLAFDSRGKELTLQPESFPHRDLLQKCYNSKNLTASRDGKSWCFPLYEGGVLFIGGVGRRVTDSQKSALSLLARQSTFGLRSAVLFDQLQESLSQEKSARLEIEEAKRELEQTQEQLLQSSKMAAVGQLAAGVAHELNSPLAAILLAIQAGKRSLGKGNLEKVAERFDKCQDATNKAKKIVDGLLTHSKKSSGQRKKTPLDEVVQQTCEFLTERLQGQGTGCIVKSNSNAQALIDSNDVSQILTNLMLNAHQAMADSVGNTKSIRLSVFESQGRVCVDVSDHGPGIPDDDQKRIFEPFFTTKIKGQGTGLGLFISAELAQKQGGELELVSSSSKGTTFRLSFPVAD